MTDTRALLLDALYAQEKDRPRSKQKMLGPSSLGSCKRQVVYKLTDAPHVNNTSLLAAIMGTAIHATIESALQKKGYGDTVELTVPGIEGVIADAHIDFYNPAEKKVTDWKTTKKSNVRYFPYDSQRWQVQVYGYLAVRAGYEVETVEIVAIPRDGTEKDIVIHSEPYDEAIALEALGWMDDRLIEAELGVLPAPEKYPAFCRLYCSFYSDSDPSMCSGLSRSKPTPITIIEVT